MGEKDGVVYVNDSKATNIDAAAKALQAFDRIRWIVGGQMKGSLEALGPHLSTVSKAYVIGRTSREVALELSEIPTEICETMASAVSRATSEAEAGDTVLLAPAGASFDQYDSFEERGDDFTREVQKLL